MTAKNLLPPLVLALVLTTPVFAQSSTPSTIRDTVKQQVEQELNEIKSTTSKKAYVGSISGKSDGTITLTNHHNQPRTALVTADAVIKLAGGKDGTPADLKVGNFAIAMGDADGQGMLTVKRLLVIPQPPAETRQVLFGTVNKVSPSSLTLKSGDKDFTVRLLASTKYTAKTKSGDIKTDSKVILVTTGTSTLTAVYLHLFP